MPAPAAVAPAPAAAVAKSAALLAELDALDWIRAETLPDRQREAVAAVFKHVPRPPRLLQQLVSPEFVNNASMDELADLIGSEPLVATRVLATANSAIFGLSSPVKGLHQAISTLGLITLRILCLQYLMIRSFKADSPERQTLLTNLWNASTLASELCPKLARAIGRPDPSRLGTLVVLSFLGRLAANATMPRGLLSTIPVGSFLERSRNEQAALGLSAAEIGGLLMHAWDLPDSLVNDVRRVDPTLVERAPDLDLALCYVCARLGEKLASGELRSLSGFDLAHDASADFHHVQSRLSRPEWAAMAAALREPALCESIDTMARALREGAAAP
jgi:HD-like signal output (HDOD) protein